MIYVIQGQRMSRADSQCCACEIGRLQIPGKLCDFAFLGDSHRFMITTSNNNL